MKHCFFFKIGSFYLNGYMVLKWDEDHIPDIAVLDITACPPAPHGVPPRRMGLPRLVSSAGASPG